jgi:two-component system, chemotaxis family, protein-glutamate methylesterase/glutaminase
VKVGTSHEARVGFQVVAIGVSTGGPGALLEVIPRLPADLGAPVLVVQHLIPEFTEALAGNLDRLSALKVVLARAGQPLEPGRVYLAPGNRHMVVRSSRPDHLGRVRTAIGLNNGPPVQSCRPAADVLFKSLAPVYGRRTLAVVMTGMGRDGREGVRAIKRQGGYCLTQSEGTCVVYGMPRAVDLAGLSDEKVPLDRLAARIAALVRG